MARPRPDTSVVKRCSGCKETLPRESFGPSKTTFDSLSAYCRPCSNKRYMKWAANNRDTLNALARGWRKNNPDRVADHEVKKRYGLPLGTYAAMLAQQDGKCAICRSDQPGGKGRFHIDHCHSTKKIRGLLCHHCNIGLGNFRNSKDYLANAVNYLTSSEGS